jgi:hypothetical protein
MQKVSGRVSGEQKSDIDPKIVGSRGSFVTICRKPCDTLARMGCFAEPGSLEWPVPGQTGSVICGGRPNGSPMKSGRSAGLPNDFGYSSAKSITGQQVNSETTFAPV